MASILLILLVSTLIIKSFSISNTSDEEFNSTSSTQSVTDIPKQITNTQESLPMEGFGDFHYPNPSEDERQDVNNTIDNFDESDDKIPDESDLFNTTLIPDEVEGCHCLPPPDVFCRCFGQSVIRMPTNLTQGLTRLSLISLGIEVLETNVFQNYRNLTDLYMESMTSLHLIESGVFLHLDSLRSVYIKFAPLLKNIPDGVFMGTFKKLKILRIVQTGLETMPPLNYLETNSVISMIDFDSNRIRNLTSNSIKVKAGIVNIDYNMIECVHNWAFNGSEIAKLSLKGNKNLIHLQDKAFEGLRHLSELDLSETSISKLPIIGIDSLETLKLQNTFTLKEIPSVMYFKNIRTAFLTYPYHCCAFKFPATHNPKEFARHRHQILFNEDVKKRYCPPKTTPMAPTENSIKRTLDESTFLSLYYETKDRVTHIANIANKLFSFLYNNQLDQTIGTDYDNYIRRRHLTEFNEFFNSGTTSSEENSAVYGRVVYNAEGRNQSEDFINVLKEMGLQHDGPVPISTTTHKPIIGFGKVDPDFHFESHNSPENSLPGSFFNSVDVQPAPPALCGDITQSYPIDVQCYPIPDAFNPCEDVMGNGFLRMLVWVVVIAAVLGNSAVMIVLMSGRFTFNVSKFLMINLAIADLMMGVYLLIIAVVDIHTVGQYFNYAIDWQHGFGCKIAGFITVFASELSIFTLTVITLERWFAITFAIQLNKRLKLGLAVKVMIGGWIYALLMASLPLMGISTYSKTSICLPMENKRVGDVAYLIALLTINGLAFVLISACYAKMYCSIISQQTRATVNDMTIAKRMALLVFTDFVCWAPIAFFGLTAIAGFPLIDVTKSKFLLVTFYPLNSCANPFLYAILTKQYRRDFFILVSRYGFCTKRAMKYKNASSHGHLRIAANRSNNAAMTGSIFSQVSSEGHIKPQYKYICRGHRHHYSCQHSDDSANSQRSAIFSTVDICPELSSRSNDSTHEFIRIGHKNGVNSDSHKKKFKNKKDKRRKYSLEFMSSEDDSTSSTLHKSSPHPVRRSQTKLNRLPSIEQQEILSRVLQKDKNKSCLTCALSHTNSCRFNRMCSICVQRDSSSGEKSIAEYDSQLLRWTKSGASKCSLCSSKTAANSGCVCSTGSVTNPYSCENASFVMSSHSNSANEDTEI